MNAHEGHKLISQLPGVPTLASNWPLRKQATDVKKKLLLLSISSW